jgi:hypothetical protein
MIDSLEQVAAQEIRPNGLARIKSLYVPCCCGAFRSLTLHFILLAELHFHCPLFKPGFISSSVCSFCRQLVSLAPPQHLTPETSPTLQLITQVAHFRSEHLLSAPLSLSFAALQPTAGLCRHQMF